MSDQNLYSIKDFCKRNALSHTQFYELLEEHPDILKTVSVPYYKRRKFITPEVDAAWNDYVRSNVEIAS
jgi:hypothetical protein|tara:strand:- start:243 stop:449 length:207 start_codon:yes stop_codon:yes gene_type:complete